MRTSGISLVLNGSNFAFYPDIYGCDEICSNWNESCPSVSLQLWLVEANSMRTYVFFILGLETIECLQHWVFHLPLLNWLVVLVQSLWLYYMFTFSKKKITSGVIVRIPTASIGARLDSWDLPEMASRNMGNEWGRPIPSGKLTVRPWQIVGFGRWMFPLKLGYFQGPTVNLPEGNPCSKKKDPYLAAWLEISIEPKCTTLLNSATCCPRIGNKTLLLEEKSSDGRL